MTRQSYTPPSGSGGTSVPTQTGNAGKVLTTDGSALSWSVAAVSSSVTAVKFAAVTAVVGQILRVDASSRTITDGVTSGTNNKTLTSATASFTANDVGRATTGLTLSTPQTIASVQSATQATLASANASPSSALTIIIGGDVTVTAPAASTAGQRFSVKKTDASGGLVIVVPAGSDTIDSLTSVTINEQNRVVTFQSDGAGTWQRTDSFSAQVRAGTALVNETGTASLGLWLPRRKQVISSRSIDTALNSTARIYDSTQTHGWTVAGSGANTGVSGSDTAFYGYGDRSLRLSTDGTGRQATLGSGAFTATDFSAKTGRVIKMLYYIAPASYTAINGISIQLSPDNTFASYRQMTFGQQGGQTVPQRLVAGKWDWITLNPAEMSATGTPDMTAITRLKLFFTDKNTSVPVDFWLGGVWTFPQRSAAKGLVVLTFDDSLLTQRTVVAPMLSKLDMRGTAFLIPDQCDKATAQYLGTQSGVMTVAQARELQDQYGWDIGLHAYSSAEHVTMSGAALETNILKSKHWLQANGLRPGEDLAAWQGLDWTDSTVRAVCDRYLRSVRTNYGPNNNGESWPPANPMLLRSHLVGTSDVAVTGTPTTASYTSGTYASTTPSTSSLADWITRTSVNSRGLSILTFHNIDPTTGVHYPVPGFTDIVKWLYDARAAGDLDVLTWNEAMELTS